MAVVAAPVATRTLSTPPEVASLNGDWLAVPDGRRGDVLVWSGCGSLGTEQGGQGGGAVGEEGSGGREPVRLSGVHTGRVTALRVGRKAVYSASAECVARWAMDGMLDGHGGGAHADAIFPHQFESAPAHIATDEAETSLLVCDEAVCLIFGIATGQLLARLEGHTARLTCGEFRGADHVVTCSEDRRFLVFDLANRCLVFQSAIVSPYAFISLAVEAQGSRCALGSTDGMVRVYDASRDYRMLHSFDVLQLTGLKERPWEKPQEPQPQEGETVVISSEPKWRRQMNEMLNMAGGAGDPEDEGGDEGGWSSKECPIIALQFVSVGGVEDGQDGGGGAAGGGIVKMTSQNDWARLDRVAGGSAVLVVMTPTCFVTLNMLTMEVMHSVWFEGRDNPPNPHQSRMWDSIIALGTAGCAACDMGGGAGGARVCVGAAFHPALSVVTVSGLRGVGGGQGVGEGGHGAIFKAPDGEGNLSVFPSGPPTQGSVLCEKVAEGGEKKVAEGPRGAWAKGGGRESLGNIVRGSGVSKDQPVTFNKMIKSSSYGAKPPVMGMFGKTGSKPGGSAKSLVKGGSSKDVKKESKEPLVKAYPEESMLPKHKQHEVDAFSPQHSGPIRHLSFSPDAARLVSASADRTICLVKAPLRRGAGEGAYLTGHTGPVNTVSWSRDSSLLVSTASDKTVRVWNVPAGGKGEGVLSIDRRGGGRGGVAKEGDKDKGADMFTTDAKDAMFYYMDRFIATAVGKHLLLYSYSLADTSGTKGDDLERLRKNHKYKLCASFESEAQSLSCFTCANSFLSPVILASGSHKSIEVWDVGQGQMVRSIAESHDRTPHCLRLNEASPFVTHPAASYDLFLSVAVGGGGGGGVCLWDLRSQKRVCKFGGYANRAHPLGASFSPCLRYIACGSEDKHCYVFDVRAATGTYMEKLGGHTDVVSDVCFNPLHPQMVTGCNDGKIRSFSDKKD